MDFIENGKYYKDFYIAATEGSYLKAATKNFKTASTISRNISFLEKQLEKKLVNTTNKGIELTTDGEKLYKELDIIFNMEIFKKNNKKEITGQLIIGTTRNIADSILAKYITKFHKLYNKVNIKIITDNATNLNEYLVKHNIDILIDYLPHINTSDKYEFEIKPLGQFNTCFACNENFFEKYGKNIKALKELNEYLLVIPGKCRRRQILDDTLQLYDIDLQPLIQMPDSKLMVDFVKTNECIGYFIDEELNNSDLIKLDLKEKLPHNIYGIIYPKNIISEVAERFVEIVINNGDKNENY